ncbi:hypothetical protein AVEN_191064-1 [Araneus ventricosus]|uniref:Uncharacterized protein n=1 Tax=Araneus ventricosus TaxID=182803 RepID=A0A4Y2AYF6_ARAVE|nr:hypothetical protein AVEN_191064-1 [Araneus ventricosus]
MNTVFNSWSSVICCTCNVKRPFSSVNVNKVKDKPRPLNGPMAKNHTEWEREGQGVGNEQLITRSSVKCCRKNLCTQSPLCGGAPPCLILVDTRHCLC